MTKGIDKTELLYLTCGQIVETVEQLGTFPHFESAWCYNRNFTTGNMDQNGEICKQGLFVHP